MNIRGKIFDVVKTEAVRNKTGIYVKFYLENLDLVIFKNDDYFSAYTGLCYEPLFDNNRALVAFKECSKYINIEGRMNAYLEEECKIRDSIRPAVIYGDEIITAAKVILDGDIAAFCKLCNEIATHAIEHDLCADFEDVTAVVEDFCRFMSVDPDIIRAFTGGSLWYRTEV